MRVEGAGPAAPPVEPAASARSAASGDARGDVRGAARGAGSRPVLWPAVVFGVVGAVRQARKATQAGRRAGRYYTAACLSTLAWCIALSATHPVARLLLGSTVGRQVHRGWISHRMLQRTELLLIAVVIVGAAALVDIPTDPATPQGPPSPWGRRSHRSPQ